MKVYLTSAYKYKKSPAEWLKSKSAECNVVCINDPEEADVIIFVESHPLGDPYFKLVFKQEIYKKYKSKCVLYHDADLSITPMRTLSPSIELWQHNPKHKQAAHYIARSFENETIDNAIVNYKAERNFLYSFIGSRTHPVRNKIIDMKHPENTFIRDTTGLEAWVLGPEEKAEYEGSYCRVMDESLFILCPRGVGPCSYRLFEAMQLGRTPVIIADSWVRIPGVEWDKFSIQISEAEIPQIPDILNKRKEEAIEMGKLARQCWERYFSPEVSLQRISSAGLDLVHHKYSFSDSISDYLQFFRNRYHFINIFRYKKNKFKKRYRL